MKDLFRAARDAAGDLVGKAQRLIPGGKSDVDDPSDDEDDDDLPSVDVADPAHEDLRAPRRGRRRADEARRRTVPVRRPTGGRPDSAASPDGAHEAGFASLLRRLDKVEGTGLTDQAVVRRILDLVGDRLSLSVGPDGITVRGPSPPAPHGLEARAST